MDVVELLLSHGATLESADILSHTTLYRAASKGHFKICRKLLGLGANPNTKTTDSNQTVLDQAIANDKQNTVKVLREEGAEIEGKDSQFRTPLFRAAAERKLEVCRGLLDYNADPNTEQVYISSLDCLMAAMKVSSYNGYASIAELLAEYDADLEKRDSAGRTSLYLAAEYRHL